jgi:hypothetical protein
MEIKKIYSVIGNSRISWGRYFGRYLSVDRADKHLKRLKKREDYSDYSFRIKESYALCADGKYFQLTEIDVKLYKNDGKSA